jgi:hypothetical protein
MFISSDFLDTLAKQPQLASYRHHATCQEHWSKPTTRFILQTNYFLSITQIVLVLFGMLTKLSQYNGFHIISNHTNTITYVL